MPSFCSPEQITQSANRRKCKTGVISSSPRHLVSSPFREGEWAAQVNLSVSAFTQGHRSHRKKTYDSPY